MQNINRHPGEGLDINLLMIIIRIFCFLCWKPLNDFRKMKCSIMQHQVRHCLLRLRQHPGNKIHQFRGKWFVLWTTIITIQATSKGSDQTVPMHMLV